MYSNTALPLNIPRTLTVYKHIQTQLQQDTALIMKKHHILIIIVALRDAQTEVRHMKIVVNVLENEKIIQAQGKLFFDSKQGLCC